MSIRADGMPKGNLTTWLGSTIIEFSFFIFLQLNSCKKNEYAPTIAYRQSHPTHLKHNLTLILIFLTLNVKFKFNSE